MSEPKWEHVRTGVTRLPVPGGWLYDLNHEAYQPATFVPNPEVLESIALSLRQLLYLHGGGHE